MSYPKIIKDLIIKTLMPTGAVPQGLVDMQRYFRIYGTINFNFSKNIEGLIIAESENFHYGTIITSAETEKELDKNIKDAILTSFDIPSSYEKEAKIERVGQEKMGYAAA